MSCQQTSLKERGVVALFCSLFSGSLMLYFDYYFMTPQNGWTNSLLVQVGLPLAVIPIISLIIIGVFSFRR